VRQAVFSKPCATHEARFAAFFSALIVALMGKLPQCDSLA